MVGYCKRYFSFRIGFANMGRVGSVVLTVSITVERYLSVCHPNRDFCVKSLLVPFPVMFAILYSIPKFFELESVEVIDSQYLSNKTMTLNEEGYSNMTTAAAGTTPTPFIEVQEGTNYTNFNNGSMEEDVLRTHLTYRGTKMRLNPWYIIFYVFWSKFLFVEIIPWVTVVILNYRIWRQIQNFKETRRTALGKDDGEFQISNRVVP